MNFPTFDTVINIRGMPNNAKHMQNTLPDFVLGIVLPYPVHKIIASLQSHIGVGDFDPQPFDHFTTFFT